MKKVLNSFCAKNMLLLVFLALSVKTVAIGVDFASALSLAIIGAMFAGVEIIQRLDIKKHNLNVEATIETHNKQLTDDMEKLKKALGQILTKTTVQQQAKKIDESARFF